MSRKSEPGASPAPSPTPSTSPQSWNEDLLDETETLLKRLFPICRSLTGPGVRETLEILREVSPFELHEVPSGTACFDWIVPDEWSIREAYIETTSGDRVVDFRESNLHVVGYSEPVDAELSFAELEPHLHTLPAMPDAIPYRTAYYARTWGFCLTHQQLSGLDRSTRYRVRIDSTLAPGHLVYGESRLPGTSGLEFLITTYCCHPSLANDNLSGMVLWALLLRDLQSSTRRYGYRFVIAPETIGSLAYLAANRDSLKTVAGGFVLTTVAGPGPFGFKRSFLGDHPIDRAARLAFRDAQQQFVEYPFDVNGSDERQFSSPGFRLPMGTICKDKYYEYASYHTSKDDLGFIRAANLLATLRLYRSAIEILETDRTYRSLVPNGEPMLGKRGLYPSIGGSIRQSAAAGAAEPPPAEPPSPTPAQQLDALRWVLFWSDGSTSLMDIAERTGLPMGWLHHAASRLCLEGLLEPVLEVSAARG